MKEAAKPSRTAIERVVELLRADILRGRAKAGARLKVSELSARYGVSAMPVREAIRVLEGERLLTLSAHRGATVRLVTVSFIANVYEVRSALEEMLAAGCARKARPADVAALEELAAQWEKAAADDGADPQALLAANLRFHALIAKIGDNEEAEAILNRGWPVIEGLRRQIGFSAPRLADIVTQHRALVGKIAVGDVEGARVAARDHCFSARDDLVAHLGRTANLELRPRG